jgi:DNA-binding NtrC family response regulator
MIHIAAIRGGGGMTSILIVEDDEHLRVLAESYLREQGHATLSAATKEQALAVFEVAKIDLLFVDVGLYDDRQVGLDLAKEAVERFPEIKVLYTTGQTVTDGMKALLVENATLLPKPYTVEQLQTILTVKFGIKPVSAPSTPLLSG